MNTRPRVSGFGGFFFRSDDPERLAQWYEDALGINGPPETEGGTAWMTEGGEVAFQPFPRDSEMLADAKNAFMLNFRCADIDALVKHLEAMGVSVELDPETYSYGRFASLADPEGNLIQLWQPQ